MSRTGSCLIGIKLFLLIILSRFPTSFGKSFNFNRRTTGVAFSPYVHSSLPHTYQQDWDMYSLEDVKTMMRVVSQRFSRITMLDVGAAKYGNLHERNKTYHSYSSIYSVEAAAQINVEMKNTTTTAGAAVPFMTIFVDAWLHPQRETRIQEETLVSESIFKASRTYSGTVEGIVICHDDISIDTSKAKMALNLIKEMKSKSYVTTFGIKVGTRQSCDGIVAGHNETDPELRSVRQEIVSESSFIICEEMPKKSLEAETGFASVSNQFKKYGKQLKNINSKIEIMGQTGWPARANNKSEVIQMNLYWKRADAWAEKNNFILWMQEAVDNPWRKGSSGYSGWWKLANDSRTGEMSSYIEKVGVYNLNTESSSDTMGEINFSLKYVLTFVVVSFHAFY